MKNCLIISDDKDYDINILKILKKNLSEQLEFSYIISLFEDNYIYRDEFNCPVDSLRNILKDKDYYSKNFKNVLDHNIYKKYSKIEFYHNIALSFNHVIGQFDLSEVRLDFIRNLTICLDILKEKKIENVIFTNIPHNQFTVVLLKILQIHKIRFLILRETITGNYIIEDSIETDIKKVENNKIYPALKNFISYLKTGKNNVTFKNFRDHSITTKKIYNTDLFVDDLLFYLNRIINLIYEQSRNVIKLISYLFSKKPEIYINDRFKKKKKNFKDSRINIFDRSNYLFFQDIKKFKFYKEYKKLSVKKVNYEEKYIYFPLHYQPEATTVPYGNFYFDQINALKILSNLSEKFNFKIFVKEHPDIFNISKTAWMAGTHSRSYIYYKNLSEIKNLKILDLKINSLDLIKNAHCVATITGNSGVETLFHNKFTIIFGDAWYEKMSKGFKKYENFDDLEFFFANLESSNHLENDEFSKFIEILKNETVQLSKSGVYKEYLDEYKDLANLFEKKINHKIY